MNQNCYVLQNQEESSVGQDELSAASQEEHRELKVRLDKWLWAARFFKTRALARNAIERGSVFYNQELVKPTIEIELDAEVKIKQGRTYKTVIIKGLSTRRKNAADSLGLFTELSAEPVHSANIMQSQTKVDQQFSENTSLKPKKVIRFLRRACIRNPQNIT